MKIVHLITDLKNGGAGIAGKRLNRALIKSGQDSIIISLYPDKESIQLKGVFRNFRNKLELLFEKLLLYPFYKKDNNIFSFSLALFGNDVSKLKSIKNADIIHLHWINFGFLRTKDIDKLLLLKKPIVWTFHDMWAFTGGCHYTFGCQKYLNDCGNCPLFSIDPFKYSLNELKNKTSFLNRINAICPSKWMENEAKLSPYLDPLKVQNIGNCIDTNQFMPADKIIAKKDLNLDPTKQHVLFGANNVNDARKGLKFLLEAIDKIDIENVEFICFGKSKLEIPGIKSFGTIKDINLLCRLYQAADVFVAPSLYDNLPNVILEAMASGTPCVAFNIGGFPDMIKHEQNGYLAKEKSSEGLAKGIIFCLKNTNLSVSARNFVIENFSEEIIAKKHIELYESI